MAEQKYPSDKNIGFDCLYWSNNAGCVYPKTELEGRRSCEGIIDNNCVYIIKGISIIAVSKEVSVIKRNGPLHYSSADIPPGNINSVFDN
jgi:hypothetical protein